ncbi:MAG: hypothetical protein AAB446_02795 [Patescibacteria group bacterium]
MKDSKNKRSIILGLVLVGLLIVAYKVMLAPPSDTSSIDENATASARVEALLQQVENIKFDTGIIEDQKFKSLKSIETPLISLPVGRENPFLEI